MTPEQILALLGLIADLRLAAQHLAAENEALRVQLAAAPQASAVQHERTPVKCGYPDPGCGCDGCIAADIARSAASA